MKKMTKSGKLVQMTGKEEAFVLAAMCAASALWGVAVYKLWALIF